MKARKFQPRICFPLPANHIEITGNTELREGDYIYTQKEGKWINSKEKVAWWSGDAARTKVLYRFSREKD